MPAIKTAAMPKVAGMARSYVPVRTARQTKSAPRKFMSGYGDRAA